MAWYVNIIVHTLAGIKITYDKLMRSYNKMFFIIVHLKYTG